MLVKGAVRECDFTNTRYEHSVQGAWVVARGTTGRWCTVMYMGPEYIHKFALESELITVEQAKREVHIAGDWLDIGEVVL